MTLYIKLNKVNKVVGISPLSKDERYIKIHTDMDMKQILYYKNFLMYDDGLIIMNNPLPEYTEDTIIYDDEMRSVMYSFPGHSRFFNAPAVVPKDSIIVNFHKSEFPMLTLYMEDNSEWDGSTLKINKKLKDEILVQCMGECEYEFI